jgi:hypothetical protein
MRAAVAVPVRLGRLRAKTPRGRAVFDRFPRLTPGRRARRAMQSRRRRVGQERWAGNIRYVALDGMAVGRGRARACPEPLELR